MSSHSCSWAFGNRPFLLLLFLSLLLPVPGAARPSDSHGHPCLEVARLDFGTAQVGARVESTLAVRNRCSHLVTLSTVTGRSPAFSVTLPAPVRIPARGTSSIPVAFTPVDAGTARATLTLITSHPRREYSAVVAGLGVAAPASTLIVAPASVRLAMGPAEIDTFRLAVTNPGTSPRAEILVDAISPSLPRPERGWRVLYLNTTMPSFWEDQLISLIKSVENVDTIEAWYGGASLPTLARMLEYDIVMVAASNPWQDSVGAGDLLADYLEAGGKVLLMASSLAQNGHPLYGRLMLDYSMVSKRPTTSASSSATLALHPITQGVGSFSSGGILQIASTNGQGAGIPLGTYANGYLVGACHPDKPLVFLNVGPYEYAGDIPRLLANTFDYLGGMMAWATPHPPFDPVIFVVPEGETRELAVAVHTHRLPAGTYQGAIRLHNVSDTDATPMEAPIMLEVAARGRLAVDPAAVDFGPAWQGGRTTRPVRLVNVGNVATRVSAFASSEPAFSLAAGLPLEIPAFSYAVVEAAFAPSAIGTGSAEVEVHSDAQEAEAPKVALAGEGIVPPILSVSPQGFQVAIPEGQGAADTLSILNPGGDSLKLAFRAVVDAAGGRPATGPEVLDVLYIHTTNHSYENPTDFFMWSLLGDPRVGTLTGFQASDSLPSLEYMQQFDAVLVVAGGPWSDPEILGNRLADYVDAGGRICLMNRSLNLNPDMQGVGLAGRIITPEYAPVAPAQEIGGGYLDRFTDNPITEDLALDEVRSDMILDARSANVNTRILGWYSNGALVGAYKLDKAVVFLNIAPFDGYNYPPATVQLISNSMRWLAETYNWFRPDVRTLALGPGEEARMPLRFGQPFGPGAGGYTGRLEIHHNAPGTGNPLAVPITLTVEGPASPTAAALP